MKFVPAGTEEERRSPFRWSRSSGDNPWKSSSSPRARGSSTAGIEGILTSKKPGQHLHPAPDHVRGGGREADPEVGRVGSEALAGRREQPALHAILQES